MPISKFNGVRLLWDQTGTDGEPLVLVHGSWGDHHNWDKVATEFGRKFRVVTYDRRGHSESERLPGQGSVWEDVDDLIALIEGLNLSPAHIVGNSFGSGIVLRCASKRPDIFRTMAVHEPPLFGLVADNPDVRDALETVGERMDVVLDLIATENMEKAAEEFMEKIAMGPGSWEKLPDMARKKYVRNAPTWLDEMQDPESLQLDLSGLKNFNKPALLSDGSASPPFFSPVIDKIKSSMPQARRMTFDGAGHVPHLSHPDRYVEVITDFCLASQPSNP